MRGISKSAVCLVAVCALALVASSAQAGSLTMTIAISPQEQAAAAAYWTKARIAAAPAMDLGIDSGREPAAASALEEEAFVGRPGSSPSGAPDPDAMEIARAAYPEDWAALEADGAFEKIQSEEVAARPDKGTSAVYTYYDVNIQTALWQIIPHQLVGRLTFNTPTGGASCSATAISGNNFVTAAHCVYDTTNNVPYSGWVFTPAYRNGSAPYGSFPAAVACNYLTSYQNQTGGYNINTWARYDVAVCSTGTNSIGQSLNNAVGFAGRNWNQPYTRLVFNAGYPAKIYTDANIANGPTQYLRSCTAETFQRTTDTLGAGCFWGRGISGGPWFLYYRPFQTGAVNQVCSVNSGLVIGQQNLYGARFTSNNIVPLCNARHC